MVDVKQIASYFCQHYKATFGIDMDEMKLHKMLYLSQRESIIQTGTPLFPDKFKAWCYGPVLLSIRHFYKDGSLFQLPLSDSMQQYKPIFDKVFSAYATKDSWSLSAITHGEYAWQKARIGYGAEDACNVDIETEDIFRDAERIKQRRYLLHKIKEVS